MIEFLSGNVPGGIGLYLIVMTVLGLVLYNISKNNDLFTPRLFRRWFTGILIFATALYIYFWFGDPPPTVFSRYSTHFTAASADDYWLAYYFRDETTANLESNTSGTNYLYREHWNYDMGVECVNPADPLCNRLPESLPYDQLLAGHITKESGGYKLAIEIRNKAGEVAASRAFDFSPEKLEGVLGAMLRWAKPHLPIKDKFVVSPANKSLVLAKDAFFRQEYMKSITLCEAVLAKASNNRVARKWLQYARIRDAARLKPTEPADPFGVKKTNWQLMLDDARKWLLGMAKENFERDREDPMLNNMIAESFILDKFYEDAENFLKIAFGENPFLLEILVNLSLLHESRFKGLPFQDRDELFRRILNIAPYHEKILERYIEKLLLNVQITDIAADEINRRLNNALRVNPKSVTALLLQGKYYTLIYRYKDGLNAFLRADSLRPNDALTQYNIGVAYFKLEDEAAAEPHFSAAVTLSDYLDAHLYLGVIYKNRGEYEKALARFRYRVANKQGPDDYYAIQAMKGSRECMEALNIQIPKHLQ